MQLKTARNGKTDLKTSTVFNQEEIKCLELLVIELEGNTLKQKNPFSKNHLSWASWTIARLAGWKEYYEKN